jgi:hypothetical protein
MILNEIEPQICEIVKFPFGETMEIENENRIIRFLKLFRKMGVALDVKMRLELWIKQL